MLSTAHNRFSSMAATVIEGSDNNECLKRWSSFEDLHQKDKNNGSKSKGEGATMRVIEGGEEARVNNERVKESLLLPNAVTDLHPTSLDFVSIH